jgi:hypothetical protein
MAFDLTAADPLMKTHFNPRIAKQHNTAAVFWNRVGVGKGIPISNRGLEIPLHITPNGSFAWFADGGTLPAGGQQGLNRSVCGFQSFAMAVQFTGAALDAAGDDAVTYARALAFNIKNSTVDAIKYLNIYSFLDSTGIIANVGAGVTLSTSVNTTVDVTGSIDNGRYLRPGMSIDFLTGTTTPVRATAPIVSVSTPIAFATSPATIVVGPATSAATLVTGDGIVVSGSFNRVMSGLKLIIDDGTLQTSFQNVNRSNVPQFKANTIPLSGSPALARDHLRRGIAVIQIARGSVDMGSLEIWSGPGQLHAYADMGWTLKRFQGGDAKKMDLGFTAYEWEGIPWIIDTDMPKDHLFHLDRSSLFKVTARELSFDDRTGSVLRQVPSSTAGQYNDAFVAFLLFRGNLGTYSPNSNTKTTGLGVPAGY